MVLYVLRLVFIVMYLREFVFSPFSFFYTFRLGALLILKYHLLSNHFSYVYVFLNFTILSGRCASLALSILSCNIL